jgi:hypothetical protein
MVSVRRRRLTLVPGLLVVWLVLSPMAARALGTAAPTARPGPAGSGMLLPGLPGLDLAHWLSWLIARWQGGGHPASFLGAVSAADSTDGAPPPPAGSGGSGVGSSSGVLVDPNG